MVRAGVVLDLRGGGALQRALVVDRSAFLIACCRYVLWVALCFSTPYEHPFISAKERDYLIEHIKPVSAAQGQTTEL